MTKLKRILKGVFLLMKWLRLQYQPCVGLGRDGRRVSGSAEHIALSRSIAAEGIVLLKNENAVLPLAAGKKLVLLGKAGEEYIRGGGGSGEVTTAYTRTLYEGLKQKDEEGKIALYDGLHEFYAENIRQQYRSGREPGMTVEPTLTGEQLAAAAAFSDTAVVAICRFSGEGWDRFCDSQKGAGVDSAELWESERQMREAGRSLFRRGDFYLSDQEEALVRQAREHFKHVIVTLNVGGIVDTTWFASDPAIEAALFIGQAGMEGALAAADILCGDAAPSGRLADTWAARLEDYPSTEGFHDSDEYVEYTEDIYVGYRYFETLPGAAEKVCYPFGYGLSYTEFETTVTGCGVEGDAFVCRADVKNVGKVPGKQVLQLYYQAPQGKLGKPRKQLGAFAKTVTLAPGEVCSLTLTIPVRNMASFDDLGKVCKSAWVLEKGEYHFFLGTNVRDGSVLDAAYTLAEDQVVEQLHEYLRPNKLPRRLLADGTYEELPQGEDPVFIRPEVYTKDPGSLECILPETRWERRRGMEDWIHPKGIQLEQVAAGEKTLDELLDELSLEEQVWLLGGQPNTGVANTYGFGNNRDHGIPNVMTADGPAGVRIQPQLQVYTTAWPTATMLASTWNSELVEQVGKAGGLELKENNLGSWLTPALNIHRSPLCGRNFEYYSEDPFMAGTMAAAMIRGIQSQGVAATPKHFAFNNKETNRKHSDSRVSQRAAREIYLKGFEIAVKQADPWMIMSSYNRANGWFTSENKELLTGVLREEWGYRGIVTTDWWTRAEHWREVKAGNDLKMACGYPEEVLAAVERGDLTKEDIRACAKRILECILKLD